MMLVSLFKKRETKYKKPKVSIIGTAVRTNLWQESSKTLNITSAPFEVVFVGNKTPNFQLPPNFRFIYSEVKPVQCLEIAARKARGEYLLVAADDCILSKGAIDILYKQFKEFNNQKAVLSGKWFKNGKAVDIVKHHYVIGDVNSPILAVCTFLKRELWFDLGGLDCRFITSCADSDLVMRAYEHGGTVVLNEEIRYDERRNKSGGINLYPEFGANVDRPLLDSFWLKEGKMSKKRLKPLRPFKGKQLLTVSQDNKGRWI